MVDKSDALSENVCRGYFSLQWHITNSCDQRCKHCYIFNSKTEKCSFVETPLEQLLLILDDFLSSCKKMNKRPYLAITGGDPLLYPHIWEFLEAVSDRNCEFSIMGNPFHITPDVAKRLYDLGLDIYQMSIDGFEETHDYFRKPGSFRATIEAMKILKKAKIHPTIMMTVSKANAKEIPDLIEWLAENTVADMISFARYCPTHADVDNMMSADDYKAFLESVWRVYNKYKKAKRPVLTFKDHLWKPFLFEKGLMSIEGESALIMDGCHCGISGLCVLADRTVYACRRMYSPVGKVPDQSIYDIFISNEMERYRQWDKIEKCKDCKLLNYCRGCRAVAYGATKDFLSADPQCWFKN